MPLVQRALTLYAGVPFARRVVVSQYESILSLGREAGFLPLPNPDAARGISASVTLGTRACLDLDGILFGVCDQPWLTPGSVSALLGAFQSHPDRICSLCYGERRGNPALFPSALFPELLSLTGDTGGGRSSAATGSFCTWCRPPTPGSFLTWTARRISPRHKNTPVLGGGIF